MKISTKRLIVTGLLAGLFCPFAFSQTANKINVVTTAVPMLRISPDARSGGMGDIGIATSPDANSSFWNLAKVGFNKNKGGAAITYTPWLKDLGLNDVFIATAAGFYRWDENQSIAASLRYFNLGSIQFTDYAGNDLQQFNPREFSFDVGYSRKLSQSLGIGLALRYIYSNLANGTTNGVTYKPGNAVAGDLSVYYRKQIDNGNELALGATMTNLGSKISYTQDAQNKDYIPANLGLGVAYTRQIDENNKIMFGLDINKLLVPTPPNDTSKQALDEYRGKSVVSSWFSSFGDAPGGFSEELREFQLSLGGEYWYNDQFAFRAGYFWEDKTKGNRKYFTLGLGLKYQVFGLNFSYLIPSGQGINRNPLSNTLRFSLIFDFDGGGGDEGGSGTNN